MDHSNILFLAWLNTMRDLTNPQALLFNPDKAFQQAISEHGQKFLLPNAYNPAFFYRHWSERFGSLESYLQVNVQEAGWYTVSYDFFKNVWQQQWADQKTIGDDVYKPDVEQLQNRISGHSHILAYLQFKDNELQIKAISALRPSGSLVLKNLAGSGQWHLSDAREFFSIKFHQNNRAAIMHASEMVRSDCNLQWTSVSAPILLTWMLAQKTPLPEEHYLPNDQTSHTSTQVAANA